MIVFFLLHSLLSTLKNKELSPVIGQKGIQGTMSSSGQSQHSEHSPHTLRRGNQAVWFTHCGREAETNYLSS